ncbi:MAG: DUF4232 domain-containing protein [Solirubrobacteraceae bacterium]
MRIRLSILAVTLAAVALALAVAGCGGSGARTTQGAGTDAAAAARSSTVPAQNATTTTTTSTAAQTGTGGAAITSAAAPATGGAHRCVASGLALSFIGGQAATGHGELGFALKDVGPACATGGYPGIQFLDRSGGALPTTPTHTTDDFFGHVALRALSLTPGHGVSFRLGVTHGETSDSGCTTAYGLQVIAPNDTATLRVSIPNGAYECGGAATVSPLAPGDSAYR